MCIYACWCGCAVAGLQLERPWRSRGWDHSEGEQKRRVFASSLEASWSAFVCFKPKFQLCSSCKALSLIVFLGSTCVKDIWKPCASTSMAREISQQVSHIQNRLEIKVTDTVSLREEEWGSAESELYCFVCFFFYVRPGFVAKNTHTHSCPSCDCVINSLEWARCHFEVAHERLLWYTAGFSRGYPESPGDAWTYTHTHAHRRTHAHTCRFPHTSHTGATPEVLLVQIYNVIHQEGHPAANCVCVHVCACARVP